MFPIRDSVPSRHLPVMTWLLLAANVLVFGYELALPEPELERAFYLYGLVPARLTDPGWAQSVGLPPGGTLGYLSSMFLHGGVFHLVANMWTLWIFGDNVEDRMGPWRFLAFYLACGVLAGLAQTLSGPASQVPTIGASGAVAGVLGAYFLLYPLARIVLLIPVFFYPLFVEVPALLYLGFWFVAQFFSGALSIGAVDAGGIAWWAHVGGFVAGLALLRLFLKHKRRPRLDSRNYGLGWRGYR